MKTGIIHQKTLTYLITKKLVKYDKTTAEQVMTLANDSTMRLFLQLRKADMTVHSILQSRTIL